MQQSILQDEITKVSKLCPQILQPDTDGDKLDLSGRKLTWLNPAQLLIHNFNAREMYICAARGMGKTTIMSLRLYDCMTSIPNGSGVFLCASLKQGYTKTLPNLVKSLEQLRGIHEGIQFKRGRINEKSGWEMPLAVPRAWENVLAMPNGCVVYLTSTMIASAANGQNLCFALSDETRFINWKTYVESVRPALRGDIHPRRHPGWSKARNPFYLSQFFVSDAGIIKKQQTWEDEENSQTDEINDLICQKLASLKYCEEVDAKNKKEGHPTNFAWQLAHSPKFQQELQYLRGKSKVFMRFSSIHNLAFLGMDYIKARKRDMPPLLYNAQILGQRITRDQSTAFYPNFNIDIHGYTPNENDETNAIYNKYQSRHKTIIDMGGYSKQVEYEAPDLDNLSRLSNNCVLDVDVQPGQPLMIAHDFNNNVNTIVTGQIGKHNGANTLNALSSMHVCNPRMLEDLMEDWCKYYMVHRASCSQVILYYDHNAKQGKLAYASRASQTTEYDFYKIIERILKKHKWTVSLVFIGKAPEHHIKFEFMNSFFAGKERFFPRINRANNEYLIASLEGAKTCMKMGKLHKYKGDEKKTTGEGLSDDEILGENNYTDMSDAYDTLAWGACKFSTRGYGSWGRGLTTKSEDIIVL